MTEYNSTENTLELGVDDALEVGEYEVTYSDDDDSWQARYDRPIGGERGAHGEIRGPTFTTDSVIGDYALNFDNHPVVQTHKSYTSADITLSLWIKSSEHSGNERLISQQDDPISGEGNHDFFIRISSDDTLEANINKDGSSGTAAEGTTNLSDGEWHHVALTVSGDTQTVYVDGSEEDSTIDNPTGQFSGAAQTVLGGLRDGSENFVGIMDDARIFTKSLTATQISDLANEVDVTDGLAARYDFEYPETPEVAIDSTGDPFPLNNIPRSTDESIVPRGLAESVAEGKALADDGEMYDTVQAAVDAASGWVFVGPGTFNETVTVSTDGLTLEGVGEGSVIDGGTSNAVDIDASDVVVKSLSLTGSYGVDSTGASTNVSVQNVSTDSRMTLNGDNSTFLNSHSDGASSDSFRVEGDESIIKGCVSLNSDNDGVRSNNCSSVIAANNVVINPAGSGVGLQSEGSIMIANRVDGAGDNGIRDYNVGNCIVANNRVSGSTDEDINVNSETILDDNLTGE